MVCLLIKLWVLLLMISRATETDTWPLRDMHHSDVIAENDLVKLFAEKYKENEEETASTRSFVTGSSDIRTFDFNSRNTNENVVRLVTSGSKIVFLEDEYDENDAAMVSAANIEIQRKEQKQNSTQQVDQQSPSLHQQQWQRRNLTDEMKVVAVSTSSSTKRSYGRKGIQLSQNNVLPTKSLLNTTLIPITTNIPLPAIVSSPIEFINLSHKSVLLIEEAEPLTISENTTLSMSASANDSVDSASTNIRHVLAEKLARDGPADGSQSVATATTYYSSTQNSTRTNHPSSSSVARDAESKGNKPFAAVSPMEEKLLPFQTVIYHDTKDGHGPQSRSISYSSISQNVDNLQAWQMSGILAEAQRNVNESLKPLLRSQGSEPAQVYSSPAKVHSVPSKFYSEPSKIYSEPAKVYAEPEQVYSEPAKIYGEPSKIYSEPSKVYSQPAKVYGEPAKTYWPRPPFAATTDAITSSSSSTSTTHRPAIVSRIAFGETHISPDAENHASPSNRLHPKHSQQQSHSNMSTHPRRFLFNLDKLPYDLLNAPEQSAKHVLETAWNTRHRSATEIRNFSADRQYPCLESSSSLLTSPVPQYQHSSQFDQHSNQNTKGLLGRDLVKCVSHSSGIYSAREEHREYTTESSHVEEHYTSTPVQNYERDSVVTNGRIHGSPGSVNFITTVPALSRSKQVGGREVSDETSAAHQRGLYNFKANANADDAADADQATEENYGDDRSNNNGGESKNSDHAEDDSGSKNNNSSDGKDESKIAYVVEGRNYRKYRVEEKTDEGFIVGEYGVVDHNDGNLRGVRYTADSTINRSLIQKALLTFLKLK